MTSWPARLVEVECPRAAGRITIDGDLTKPAWRPCSTGALPPAEGETLRCDFSRFEAVRVHGKPLPGTPGWSLNPHGVNDSHIPESFSIVGFVRRAGPARRRRFDSRVLHGGPMHRRRFLAHTAAMAVTPLGAHAAARPSQVAATSSGSPLLADGGRVNGWLLRFDAVGRTSGGINRVAYSEGDLAGRAFTLDRYREAGLSPRIDPAGNIVARLEGRDASAVPIVIGSHVDSVTDGGNFDGPLGSLAAIEVARSLRAQDLRLRHPLEVVVWANEEGGTIGSKLAVGEGASVDLDAVSRSGRTHRQGIGLIGGDVSKLADAVRARGSAHCYLELHIEQGGRLEQAGLTIGVVEGIVGLGWLEVGITGSANHAGTTLMDQRQDAMLAAAKFTVAVHDAVRSEPGRHVATVGRLVASPNTRNVIAGRVDLTVDVRDLDNARIEHFVGRFRAAAKEIGAATSTTFAISESTSSKPAMADPRLMDSVQASADALGLAHQRMPSGAGHDAQHMALVCPMGMIFVPSVGGISHSPREFTRPEDVAHGVNVLLNAVVRADAL